MLVRKCLIFLLFLLLASSACFGQKWDSPIRPIADNVPNSKWYSEVMELTAKVKEQASQIKALSQTIKDMKPLEGSSNCDCGTKWEDLEERIQALEKGEKNSLKPLTGLNKEVKTSEGVISPMPVFNSEGKIVIEMHTFKEINGVAQPCVYCDRWLLLQAPKFDTNKYLIITVPDVVGQKVPQFKICMPSGTCYSFTGYTTAEKMLKTINGY